MTDNGENQPPYSPGQNAAPESVEHLNIKVTDNNNEVFFKIKRTTQLKKLMDAFCDRQGKMPQTVRFLFEGTRVNPTDTPDTVCSPWPRSMNSLTRIAGDGRWRYAGGPPGADRRLNG